MKKEEIKIYIDRLANEGEFEQNGLLPASLLELSENDGKASEIAYKLKAYIADEHLVVTFDASCNLQLPCKICNELTPYQIDCAKQTHLEPLNGLRKGFFEASSCLRDAILLNVPPYCECLGNCPERTHLKKFLKQEHESAEVYHPFQGL